MKIVKKISKKTVRSRILAHLHASAEAWGLDMEKARKEEARAHALIKANQELALTLLKGGYITAHDFNLTKA